MKLGEVQCKEKVSTGDVGDYTNRFQAVRGWELTLEQGLVTAKKGETVRVIPLANVSFAVPLVEAKKADKPGPKAA